jgi:hypothetical protein
MAFNGVVEAPKTAPARFGLLSVADVVNHGSGDEHWVSKVAWQSETCSFDVEIVDVCQALQPELITDAAQIGDSEATGWAIDVTDKCTTTFQYSFAERKLRLEHATEVATQYAAEKMLWAEFEAAAIADAPGGTGGTVAEALAVVEQALGGGVGAAGVIHVSRNTATQLIAESLVHQSPLNPDQLETILGTPVVAGHGYENDRIYGTGSVVLHLGQIVIYEGQNVSINDLVNKAERPAELVWDVCCLVAATPTAPAQS